MKDLPWNGGCKPRAQSASGGIVTSVGLGTATTHGGSGTGAYGGPDPATARRVRGGASALEAPSGTRVSVQPISGEAQRTISPVGRFKT